MSDEQKAPLWVALLAGAVVMGTGPFSFAFLLVGTAPEGETGAQGLFETVTEGGLFSYAVLLAAAVGSLLAAMWTAVSVRRPGIPPSLGLLAFLLPILAALLGVWWGMRGVLEAVAQVAPSEKGVIITTATGELAGLLVQGLSVSMAGTFAVTLAMLIALLGPARGPRVVTALGAGVLGLCLASMTIQVVYFRNGLHALGRVLPDDRALLLWGLIEEWQAGNRISNGLFLSSLVVAIVGGVVLAMKHQRAAGIGVAATLLVAAVGFRGFNALAERQLSIAGSVDVPQGPELKVVDGVQTQSWGPIELSDSRPERVDEEIFKLLEGRSWHVGGVGLAFTPQLTPEMTLRLLQTTHLMKVQAELVGNAPKREVVVPPLFAGAVKVMGRTQLAVQLRVLFPEEACPDCVAATLTQGELQVGGKTWTRGDQPLSYYTAELPGAEIAFPTDLDSLARAGLGALANDHVLVVRVPLPDPMPSLPEQKVDDDSPDP